MIVFRLPGRRHGARRRTVTVAVLFGDEVAVGDVVTVIPCSQAATHRLLAAPRAGRLRPRLFDLRCGESWGRSFSPNASKRRHRCVNRMIGAQAHRISQRQSKEQTLLHGRRMRCICVFSDIGYGFGTDECFEACRLQVAGCRLQVASGKSSVR